MRIAKLTIAARLASPFRLDRMPSGAAPPPAQQGKPRNAAMRHVCRNNGQSSRPDA